MVEPAIGAGPACDRRIIGSMLNSGRELRLQLSPAVTAQASRIVLFGITSGASNHAVSITQVARTTHGIWQADKWSRRHVDD